MKISDLRNVKIGKRELIVILAVLVFAVAAVLIVRNSDSANRNKRYSSSFVGMGETINVTCYGKNGKTAVKEAKSKIRAVIKTTDSVADLMTAAAVTIEENNVTSALITIGENVLCIGAKPDGSLWRVGIKGPGKSGSSPMGAVKVRDCAVFTVPDEDGEYSVTVVSENPDFAEDMADEMAAKTLDAAVTYWQQETEGADQWEMIFITEDAVYATEGLKEIFSCSDTVFWIEK